MIKKSLNEIERPFNMPATSDPVEGTNPQSGLSPAGMPSS